MEADRHIIGRDAAVAFESYLRLEAGRSPHTVYGYISDVKSFADWLCHADDNKCATKDDNVTSPLGNTPSTIKDLSDLKNNMQAGSLPSLEASLIERPDKIAEMVPEEFDPLSVTTLDIRAWLADMAAQGWTPRTLRRRTQSLRAFFKFLMKRELLQRSPATDIRLAKIDKPLPEFVRPEELEAVIDAEQETIAETDNPGEQLKRMRNSLMVEILYSTGIRCAELAGLRDVDIDLNKLEIKVTGKRNKQRVLPITDELAEKITRYRDARNAITPPPPHATLFYTKKGTPVSTSTIYSVIHKELQPTSAGKKSPHVLRHTFATVMLNNGADINSVKEFLGHESLETTQIYTHVSFAEMQRDYLHSHPRARKNGKGPANGS